jgi:hypothetical protein
MASQNEQKTPGLGLQLLNPSDTKINLRYTECLKVNLR